MTMSQTEIDEANRALVDRILPTTPADVPTFGDRETIDLRPHLTTAGRVVRRGCDHVDKLGQECGRDASYVLLIEQADRRLPRVSGRCAKHIGAISSHWGRRGDFDRIEILPVAQYAARLAAA